MKHLLAVLLCLLLCGCGRPEDTAVPFSPEESQAASVKAGLYAANHPMEAAYPGEVRAYLPTLENLQSVYAMGNDVLVLSGFGRTTITCFTGDLLWEAASLTLDFQLQPEDPSLQVHPGGLSFFDPVRLETVVLDNRLQEIRRIAAPEGLSGVPILTADGKILYYCTGWSVAAWNLETGIRQTLKEMSYPSQELTALHLSGQVLECTIRDKDVTSKLLLSGNQGVEIRKLPEDAALHTGDSRYLAAVPGGYQTLLLFGETDAQTKLLLPEQSWDQQFYLPEDHAVITATSAEKGLRLDYYELNTGILRSSLNLDTTQIPRSVINCKGHSIYILTDDPAGEGQMLYRWDVLRQPPDPTNGTTYVYDYHNAEKPDSDALKACQDYAASIGKQYGITIRVWEDALAVQPWDYQFQPEYLAPVLEKDLHLLQQRLARYPQSVLDQTKSHFSGLTICLVRQITGTGDSRSLNRATGIQFFEGTEAYVVITTGKHAEQALYHELYHVMETHLLTESTALDRWDTLNPAGFAYGSPQPDTDIYLQGETRAFVDRYSMNYLKEDRARVLENAMLPGKQEVFQSEYMQRKLTAMCTGLREAYGLKKHPEVLPWEQYLINPLTPKS